MAKSKRVYSSVGLDDDIYKNSDFLKSSAMERIEQEQGATAPASPVVVPEVQATQANVAAEEKKAAETPVLVAETKTADEEPLLEAKSQEKTKEVKYDVGSIFSKDALSEKDFTSAILHNDVLEELHELARIRDHEGRKYPVKYLASNIIRNYLQEHKKEIEAIRKQSKKRRS